MSENARLCVALIQEKTAEVLRHFDEGIVQAGYHSILCLDVVGRLVILYIIPIFFIAIREEYWTSLCPLNEPYSHTPQSILGH